MAASKSKPNAHKSAALSLQALTAAALALPGLPSSALAFENEASFGYGHYQEGSRNLFGAESAFSPIEVETVQGGGSFDLADRVKFAFDYTEDTWGGATPIATLPLAFGGNGHFTGNNQVVTGATPFLTNQKVLLDSHLNPVEDILVNPDTGEHSFQANNQLVHTMAMASPEVRKQGDFNLDYEWDNANLGIGGGVSIEDDYESSFGNIGGRWDFNQKQTSVSTGLSYTSSDTLATLDHDASPYIIKDKTYDPVQNVTGPDGQSTGSQLITGNRQDWATTLGLTQVINKNALLEASLGYTRSTGYMANPYKAVSVVFIDPANQDPFGNCPEAALGFQCAEVGALLEQRPEERNQWSGNLRYVQYVEPLNAAVHLGYRIFSDDWGITSHTFDADWAQPLGNGWTITPKIRYYSQDAASFYTPMLVTDQGATSNIIDPVRGQAYSDGSGDGNLYFDDLTGSLPIPVDSDGNPVVNPLTGNAVVDSNGNVVSDPQVVNSLANATRSFDRSRLPQHYSSDHRLSGYGALSGGLTLSKQFARGIGLDLGFEYYTHQGGMKMGGGGEGSYADFDYWTANATLKVDLAALSLKGASGGDHAHHHAHHHGAHAPAGVMFDHMLPNAGDLMVGYRYMYGNQAGDMLHGSNPASAQAIVDGGCGPTPCFLKPTNMTINMHMLDLMYAPTDWLTLMLMPQFMDMDMSMGRLRDDSFDSLAGDSSLHIAHHVANSHETGGIGDLGMYSLFKLYDDGMHHAHITAGLSAPTGDVDIKLRRNHQLDGGFADYGMQLGSGTWDFKPSLTYTGHFADWIWGAQVNGTVRMEERNESGYSLGDMFQTTAWGGYGLTDWLSATVRGIYTVQGPVNGQFNGFVNELSPSDHAGNYGGRYWDLGLGLSAVVSGGDLAGNRFSVEWLQPLKDDVNGYQLERDGALSAAWSMAF